MKKSVYKKILTSSLYILIPFTLGFLVSLYLKAPFFLISGIFFIILLVFLIPSGSLDNGFLDYNTKSINPTFRPENKLMDLGNFATLLNVILVVMALIFCGIMLYLDYK